MKTSFKTPKEGKYISRYELVSYVVGISSLTLFMGMINNYRGDYLNNIVKLSESNQQIVNIIVTVVGYVLGFFVTKFIDNFKGKRGKFRPIAMASCIPFAVFGFLMFYTPMEANSFSGIFYITAVMIIYNLLSTFANTANNVAIVMTPNEKERNSLFSVNSFFSSILSSGALVVVLVLGIFKDKGYFDTNQMYIIGTALCAVVYAVCMMNAMSASRERIPYLDTKSSVIEGIRDVVKNKNFWCITLSTQLRNLYHIGTGLGIYIAGVLLGDTSKYLLIGLPTGVGTFVGMLIVQQLIKKIDPVKVMKAFCVYSLCANTLAFIAGYKYLTVGGTVWQILFLFFLFTIGFQYGANNIIPNILNADVLNELEMQTGGKRLEQTVSFTQGFVGTVTGVISGILSPFILLNENMINYQQGVAQQTQEASIKLVFFYTIFAGICFVISILPLLGYSLNPSRRDEINKVLEVEREKRIAASDEVSA